MESWLAAMNTARLWCQGGEAATKLRKHLLHDVRPPEVRAGTALIASHTLLRAEGLLGLVQYCH